MTTVNISADPIWTFDDNNGNALVGGKLYTYQAGTSTPLATYNDSTGATPNTNPIILNNRGDTANASGVSCGVWVQPAVAYKFVLQDSAGNMIWTLDNYIAGVLSAGTVTDASLSPASVIYAVIQPYEQSAGETTAFSYNGGSVQNFGYPVGNAFRYLTAAQLAKVLVYDFSIDSTTNMQWCLDAAYFSQVPAVFPAGGYLVNGVGAAGVGAGLCSPPAIYGIGGASQLLNAPIDDYRNRVIRIQGAGSTSNFTSQGVTKATYFRTTTGTTIFRSVSFRPQATQAAQFQMYDIYFSCNNSASTAPVVQVDTFGTRGCEIKRCGAFQAGTGDGWLLYHPMDGVIQQVDSDNRDWQTQNLGGARVGTGFNMPGLYNAGLLSIKECHARGFKVAYQCGAAQVATIPATTTFGAGATSCTVSSGTGIQFGAVVTGANLPASTRVAWNYVPNSLTVPLAFSNTPYMTNGASTGSYTFTTGGYDLSDGSVIESESSTVNTGVVIPTATPSTNTPNSWRIQRNYFEGCDTSCIVNGGQGTVIRDNFLYPGASPAGWTVGIDDSSSNSMIGTVIDGNNIQMTIGPNVTAISTFSTGSYGGAAKTVTNNLMVFNGSAYSGSSGLLIAGVDPRVFHAGNMYSPRGAWTGSNNLPIRDNSTSGDASTVTGVFGFGATKDGNYEYPKFSRAVMSYGTNATPLGNGAVAANVLTLPDANLITVTFTSGQTVNSIALAGHTDAMLYVLHVTNGNCTFTQGASIKLSGSANYTPGANGAFITFVVIQGVAWEVSRTAY